MTLILAVKGEDGVWKYLSLNDLKSLEEAAKDRSESGDSSGGEEYEEEEGTPLEGDEAMGGEEDEVQEIT